LIRFQALDDGPSFARIVAEIDRKGNPQRIEIRILLEGQRLKKEFFINGVKRRARDLAGKFRAVLFLPRDMLVVEGSPNERRSYLDQAFSQVFSGYASNLSEYAKALSQRNALLKQLKDRRTPGDELKFWDEKIADLSAKLVLVRARGLRELESHASVVHRELAQDSGVFRMTYLPSIDFSGTGLIGETQTEIDWTSTTVEELREAILDSLRRVRREELQRGITISGPHRDDLSFRIDDLDLRMFGSRGQNRTAMLAAKIGEINWIHDHTGEWPVLLLDEVLAELDPVRRRDMLSRVVDVNQVLITTTDLEMFPARFSTQAAIWEISAGELSKRTF
jgi:DNA replication and repair protein RecF